MESAIFEAGALRTVDKCLACHACFSALHLSCKQHAFILLQVDWSATSTSREVRLSWSGRRLLLVVVHGSFAYAWDFAGHACVLQFFVALLTAVAVLENTGLAAVAQGQQIIVHGWVASFGGWSYQNDNVDVYICRSCHATVRLTWRL